MSSSSSSSSPRRSKSMSRQTSSKSRFARGPRPDAAATAEGPNVPLRRRPQHTRRASQPAPSSTLLRSRRPEWNHNMWPPEVDALTNSASSSSESDSDLEDVDLREKLRRWDAKGKAKDESLEYLDLSLSLPFTVIAMRDNLLSYLASLEDRAKTVASRLRLQESANTLASASTASSSQDFVGAFYAQLEAIRGDLRRLALLFPSPSTAFPSPAAAISSSQAAISARSQSLAADWDKISEGVRSRLPNRPTLQMIHPDCHAMLAAADPRKLVPLPSELPSMPALAMPDISPMPALASVMAKMHAQFDSLQESVTHLTLRDCWEQRKREACANESAIAPSSEKDATSRSRRSSFSAHLASSVSLPSWDSIMTSVRESSSKGRDRAGSVVQTIQDVEHAMYLRACELASSGSQLIRYQDLPVLWKNNEYILSGYRFIPLENWGTLLKSTFQLHNETINIHSHLLGVLVVLPLFWPSKGLDPQTTWADRLVQTIYLIAAMKCLISSVVWHVFAGCSHAVWFERAACVDYSGVALLVAASVWTTIYNEFYCQPNIAMLYSFTTLIVGIIGAVVPWASWFNDRRNKGLRIIVFLSMCFTSLLPFFHAVFSHGFTKTINFLSPILPSLLAYITGLVLYATNFPERLRPGAFDIFGHAHQFWHISIVLAILLHFRAALKFHEGRFEFSCTDADLSADGGENQSYLTSVLSSLFSSLLSSFSLTPQSGVKGLYQTDETIHSWRIMAGRLGGGKVGQVWDWALEGLQRW